MVRSLQIKYKLNVSFHTRQIEPFKYIDFKKVYELSTRHLAERASLFAGVVVGEFNHFICICFRIDKCFNLLSDKMFGPTTKAANFTAILVAENRWWIAEAKFVELIQIEITVIGMKNFRSHRRIEYVQVVKAGLKIRLRLICNFSNSDCRFGALVKAISTFTFSEHSWRGKAYMFQML